MSSSTTEAVRVSGTKVAAGIRERLAAETKALIADGIEPSFVVVLVGDRGDSATYVRMKEKAAAEIGIRCTIDRYAADITQEALVEAVKARCDDASVHGIIVQLPLPDYIDENTVLSVVPVEKDIDGFDPANLGCLGMRGREALFAPCTPEGVMTLIDSCGTGDIAGRRAVVLGRSATVGLPAALLLLQRSATVTICHSKTHDIDKHLREADIVVAAVGRPAFVKAEWLKPGAIVIDVGTNAVKDETKKSGIRLVGDVEPEAKKVAGFLSPVPGGVGPMTVATLMEHVVRAAQRKRKRAET